MAVNPACLLLQEKLTALVVRAPWVHPGPAELLFWLSELHDWDSLCLSSLPLLCVFAKIQEKEEG